MINNMLNKIKFSYKHTLPVILQSEIAECGIVCVLMIANYYGYEIDLITIRKQFDISLQGSTLQDLIDLSDKLNLSSRALKLDLHELVNLKIPCILHWDMNHFVVLKKVTKHYIIIHDPAIGVVKHAINKVSKSFTGIALELFPSNSFKVKKNSKKISFLSIFNSIKGLKIYIIQIMLISLCLEALSMLSPFYFKVITDHVIPSNNKYLIFGIFIGFFILNLIQIMIFQARSWIILYFSNTLNVELTSSIIKHLLKLPISFFEKRHIGDIISRFNSIYFIQEKLSISFIETIIDGIVGFFTLCIIIYCNTKLSIIIFFSLFLFTILKILLYKLIKLQNEENINFAAKESSIFIETLRIILPIKIFNKELSRENVWKNSYINKLNTNIKLSKLNLLYQLLDRIIFLIEYMLIIALGSINIINNDMSIGLLIAYISYSQQFITRYKNLIDKIIEYKMINIHIDRLSDIINNEEEKDFSKIKNHTIKGDIEIKNLFFKYSQNTPYVINNLNLKINKGEFVAITGLSGCGKTTLIKLMLSLFNPEKGQILIDNIDIKTLGIKLYRKQIAAVMQEDSLISGSIIDNIVFFDDNIDIKKVIFCTNIASIHNEIMNMTMGYETYVGDLGSTLSGGQKQRILLARALYKNPKIIFLDESTSHLDHQNEKIINENIKQLGITRISVAHRQETINIADRIITL